MSLTIEKSDILSEPNPFGAKLIADDTALFRFWSPLQHKLLLNGKAPEPPKVILPDARASVAMTPLGNDWFEAVTSGGMKHGTRYALQVWNIYDDTPDWITVPDPMSYWQEKDVHGYSKIIDPNKLTEGRITWQGVPHEDLVLEQIHIGAFTKEGTFQAAIEKFSYLSSIGITGIQLMPVEATAAKANWGYDGVLKAALQSEYGTPEDFAHFVNEAHRHGIAVLTDQVFNHFAGVGNYLEIHTPEFFKYANIKKIETIPPEKRKASRGYETPWGTALDLSRPEVRKFIEQLEWHNQVHYGTDGVRRDAVHGLKDSIHAKDPSRPHILTSMSAQRKRYAAEQGNIFHVINEDEHDRPTLYAYPDSRTDRTRADMQWGDNFHHALFVAVTKDLVQSNSDIKQLLTAEKSYYRPYYMANSTKLIVESITTGNAFSLDTARNKFTSEEDRNLPPDVRTKVVFPTNHDHIGNTPHGLRLAGYLKDDPMAQKKTRFLNSLTAFYPGAVPQFFMGQSWNSQSLFPFFAAFDDEAVNESYRQGRKKELAQFDDFVDPAAPETFQSAKLDWNKAVQSQAVIDDFKHNLKVRRQYISPHIASGIEEMEFEYFGENGAEITAVYSDGARVSLAFNAGSTSALHQGRTIGPWEVSLTPASEKASHLELRAVPA